MAKSKIVDEIASKCLVRRVRTLNRVLTNIYDEELRPFGLKSSQLNLLVVIAKRGPVRRIDIGKVIALDPSTLTRNLSVMQANGWIEDVLEGTDGRGNPVRLTAKGLKLIERIAPAWRKAQARTSKFLGKDGSEFLVKTVDAVGRAALG